MSDASADLRAGAHTALSHYELASIRIEPLGTGLINETFLVETASAERYVLQRLNPIFPASVNEVIDEVTTHLAARAMCTPRLLRTRGGERHVSIDDRVWRVLTYIDGISYAALPDPGHAAAAGRLLGRFHAALADFDWRFAQLRTGVHDLPRHLRTLERALVEQTGHRRFAAVAPLAEAILAAARALAPLPPLPARVAHGDPKIGNVLFDRASGEALCLVDLDTLGPLAWVLELGDAFRSWCNPVGEDARAGQFDLELFASAIGGYAQTIGAWLRPEERSNIVLATETICIELAARFCADALNERYFGWDPRRFASRSEHNEVRAAGQLRAAQNLAALHVEAEAIVTRAFA